MSFFNYTEIVKRDDKEYLYDPQTAGQRARALEEMQDTHAAIFKMLRGSAYPPSEVYCRAVANNGGRGLSDAVSADALQALKEHAPGFLAKQLRDMAVAAIPSELLARADELQRELIRRSDGVPAKSEDETYDPERGIVLDVEAITGRIEQGCSMLISDETRALAKEISSAILELRRLRYKRVNIREIVQYKLGDPVRGGYPDLSDLEMLLAASVRLLPPDAVIKANLAAQNAHPVELKDQTQK